MPVYPIDYLSAVWDRHEENQEPRRIALQLPYRIPPVYTLKIFIYLIEYHPK